VKRAFTLVEVLFSVLLVSLLFSVGFRIIQQSREEMQKAFWLQECMIGLRNATRLLGKHLKKTSYPSTIVRKVGTEEVISFKEVRTYDGSGRLRALNVKDDKRFDLQLMTGHIEVTPTPQQIMIFPMCIPEKDDGTVVPGTITWVEVLLEPDDSTGSSGSGSSLRGRLRVILREESYNTAGLASRAYSLQRQFNPGLAATYNQILVGNLTGLDVSMFESEELRGVAITEEGTVSRKMKKRYLVSCRFECQHPRDERWKISDQVTVVNNIDLTLLGGGINLIVLSVNDDGANSSAQIRYNGTERLVRAGDSLGNGLMVKTVFSMGIQVQSIDGKKSMTFYRRL
jgi:hypothetical protein